MNIRIVLNDGPYLILSPIYLEYGDMPVPVDLIARRMPSFAFELSPTLIRTRPTMVI